MAETQTPNFKWTKPDIGGDATTWGNVLNTTFDAIDAVAWANQQAGTVIGTIQMFAGTVLPPNWLWCNGAVYIDTDVPALAPVLQHAFPGSDATHTAVPNLWSGRGAIGYDGVNWGMGATGGEYNHTIALSEMPVHSHAASQAAHTHSVYQDVHVHYVYQDAHAHTVGNTAAHSHVIVTGNHNHPVHTGAHSHGGVVGPQTGGGNLAGQIGGAQYPSTRTDTAGDLGGYTDTATNLGGYTDTQALAVGNTDTRQPGVYADNRQPAVHCDTQAPAVSVANAGSGVAANNMQPYTVVGFIIRYQ